MKVKPILTKLSLDKVKTSNLTKSALAVTGMLTGGLALKNNLNADVFLYNESQDSVKDIPKAPIRREDEPLGEFLMRLEEFYAEKKRERAGSESIYTDTFDYEEDDDDDLELNLVDNKKDLKKCLENFDNKSIKNVIKKYYNSEMLFNSTVDILREIDANLKNIPDKKIHKMVDNILKEIISISFEEDGCIEADQKINVVNNIIDAYNNINNNYVQYRDVEFETELPLRYFDSITNSVYKLSINRDNSFQTHLDKYFSNPEVSRNHVAKDFILRQRTESLEKLPNGEARNYLYYMYIKNLDIPSTCKTALRKILKEFDVMVLPASNNFNLKKIIDYIAQELSEWKRVSSGEAIKPKTIKLNTADVIKFKEDSVAYADIDDGIIQMKRSLLSNVQQAIRHEIMHLNDRNIGLINKLHPEEFYLDDEVNDLVDLIMPKILKNGYLVPDYKNCLYREEFLNAGIEPKHIEYAYQNRREFLAVASEGDSTKYSPEFKEVLKKLGMPEYVFDLEVSSIIKSGSEQVEKIRRENPSVTDFDALSKLVLALKDEAEDAFNKFFEMFSSYVKK